MKLKITVLLLFVSLLLGCTIRHSMPYRKTYEEESEVFVEHFKKNFRIGGIHVYSVYKAKKEQIKKATKYEKDFTKNESNSQDKKRTFTFLKKIKSKARLDDFDIKLINELYFFNDYYKLSLTIEPEEEKSSLLFNIPF